MHTPMTRLAVLRREYNLLFFDIIKERNLAFEHLGRGE